MRVLFVSPVSYAKGGAEKVLLDLLATPGISPVLAVPEPGELSEAAAKQAVPVACYHPTALNNVHRPPRLREIVVAVIDVVRCAVRLRRIAREHDCDIVHTNGLKAHALGIVLRSLGARVLVHFHDIPYSRLERVIWRAIGLFSTRMAVVSRSCWPAALGRKVSVLPNSITIMGEHPDWQRTLAYPFRLGFIGRYHPHKGLDRVVDWIKALEVAGIDMTLVLRGRPDEDHPEYWTRISHRINDEDLRSVIIDQGWKTGEDVYRDIDILLLLSDHPDPAPLSILEAMIRGVLVIAYPTGGIPDLIPEGTGKLVGTPDEFMTALRAYRRSPELVARTRHAAFEHVRQAHNPCLIGEKFLQICEATR